MREYENRVELQSPLCLLRQKYISAALGTILMPKHLPTVLLASPEPRFHLSSFIFYFLFKSNLFFSPFLCRVLKTKQKESRQRGRRRRRRVGGAKNDTKLDPVLEALFVFVDWRPILKCFLYANELDEYKKNSRVKILLPGRIHFT